MSADRACPARARVARVRSAAAARSIDVRSGGEEGELERCEPDWRARRWVVERAHACLNRFGGLLSRWSKKPLDGRALRSSPGGSSRGEWRGAPQPG